MPSGGHARSGPPPDPNALRRERDKHEWQRLPAAGRTTPAPDWPLTKATARELVIWAEEWKRPQAVAWEEYGLVRQVALYVRNLREAEAPGASVGARTLVARHEDALGLSVAGLRLNRWVIVDDADRQPEQSKRPATAQSARDRLISITGGAAS